MAQDLSKLKTKPTPTWTALLEGGCVVAGYDFKRLSRRRDKAHMLFCMTIQKPPT